MRRKKIRQTNLPGQLVRQADGEEKDAGTWRVHEASYRLRGAGEERGHSRLQEIITFLLQRSYE